MAEDAIQSFLRVDSYQTSSIPEQRTITCDCSHAASNQKTFDDLERDLRTAAGLGKALLARHETYVADAEKDRKAMMAHIESLETDKSILENKNAAAIRENRSLLDQLEALNCAVADSDAQATDLQSALRSTQQELHRLSGFATRAEKLEQQIAEFEREQALWQSALEEKDETAKSALRRWQDAQRSLTNVQDEIDRIEREAREEKERHVEVLGRMERRHAVERELNSAAGRLKGAAAVKSAGRDSNGTSVVSHFVKDILQDNANLQLGIVELREMLQTSNEEVEGLRKQLSINEPAGDPGATEETTPKRPTLNEEMRRATSSELHVHHHYHAPSSAAKTGTLRRPKKKRYGALTSGHFTPPSGTSTPRSSVSYGVPSSAATILQQTAASLPDTTPMAQRWSVLSNHTFKSTQDSSGPSSPHSTHRTSSLFDRVFSDAGPDFSRPTTPGTEDPDSPILLPSHSKRPSRSSNHSYSEVSGHRPRPSLDAILDMSIENLRHFDQQNTTSAIPEVDELNWENTSSPPPDDESSAITPLSEEQSHTEIFKPRIIRRVASHESLLSVSGMDIHTLKSRPSQLLAPQGGRSFTSQAVLSDTTALPAAMSQPFNSSRNVLRGMAADQQQPGRSQGIGRKMGGWMFGRWGVAPSSTASVDATSAKPDRASSVTSGSDSKSTEESPATPRKPKHRPPGINQIGPIPGLGPEVKRQHAPIVGRLDEEALRNILREN